MIDGTPLFNYINERHAIYLRKQRGEAHLTDDPILAEYSFCNVFRELDRVTIWVRENIREPYADHPDLWLMLAIARTINWPDTLAELIAKEAWPVDDSWHWKQLADVLCERSARKNKVYTGAYMVRAESDPRKPWYRTGENAKHLYIGEIVIGRLWQDRQRWRRLLGKPGLTLRDVWLTLAREPHYVGWGGDGFMAYEVVTDMRHTRYLRDASDIMTWTNAGPGAKRGLNRLQGRPLKAPVESANYLMRELLVAAPAHLGAHVPPLEMRDIEHSLCELDKYLRVQNGEGKPRARYVARPKPAAAMAPSGAAPRLGRSTDRVLWAVETMEDGPNPAETTGEDMSLDEMISRGICERLADGRVVHRLWPDLVMSED